VSALCRRRQSRYSLSMVSLEKESNIEVLRSQAIFLRDEIDELRRYLKRVENGIESSKQDWLDPAMRDRLSRLEKKLFSGGREALPRLNRPVGHENEQLKLHGERSNEETQMPAGNSFQCPILYNYKLSERELKRESLIRQINGGAEAWEEVPGLFQESKEITVHELIYQEAVHRQCKYRLKKEFNKFGKEVLITAPGPAKVRPQSKYSIDFAVEVALDKYGFHMPLERQRRKMEGAGLEVDVKTLYGLCEAVAEHCRAVEERIRQDIFSDFCAVHVDESPWPILGGESQSYMWAVSNRKGSCYRFEPTRSGKVAEELIDGFEGAVLTDGFSGYNRLKKDPRLRMGACWSHARREFYERLGDFPEDAATAVEIIDKLFAIEAKAKTFDQLRDLRRTESKAVLEDLRKWMLGAAGRHLGESGIRKAINYTMKLWPELTRFTEDLSLPLSNNDAERALRHIVMGRKNFNGSKTINGADTAASIYTVIESAKKAGLEPRAYLKYLIEARWRREQPKTPHELALEKLGPNKRVKFPEKADWKI
jgi:transposase